tara:strand:- start:475 stop:753 length:279 start_codon:yes stop_codon:yes gene_type:complete
MIGTITYDISLTECKVSTIFAYFSIAYIVASIYYFIVTRSYGTPFKDALKKYPELLKIKQKSASKRAQAFYIGLLIGVSGLVLLKPFGTCWT